MTDFPVADARAVVVGAGRSGIAAARLLTARGARVTLSEMDPGFVPPDGLAEEGIAVEVGGHRAATLHAADLIVPSPGVSPALPGIAAARRRGVPVISEVELAARWLKGPLVAITGTKGKSTTVAVTARMLAAGGRRALVGGNIGVALSSQVEESRPDVVHVVEVSSFQLELTRTFRPWIAVCLNLSPDHLDRHATFADYAAAKARVFANQTPDDAMVINADDPHVLAIARAGRARALRFAVDGPLAAGVQVTADGITHRSPAGEERLVPMSAVRVPGRHLLADIAAAAAVGALAGIGPEAMTAAVRSFTGLEHALELVGEIGGVRFVNDSKATNPVAARSAIECFGPGLVVILGGRFKGGRFEDLQAPLAARGASVVAIGEARAQVRRALEADVPVCEAGTMEEAVRQAAALARPGGAVLLAPACASFDMYGSYAERGGAFRNAVAALVGERTPARDERREQ